MRQVRTLTLSMVMFAVMLFGTATRAQAQLQFSNLRVGLSPAAEPVPQDEVVVFPPGVQTIYLAFDYRGAVNDTAIVLIDAHHPELSATGALYSREDVNLHGDGTAVFSVTGDDVFRYSIASANEALRDLPILYLVLLHDERGATREAMDRVGGRNHWALAELKPLLDSNPGGEIGPLLRDAVAAALEVDRLYQESRLEPSEDPERLHRLGTLMKPQAERSRDAVRALLPHLDSARGLPFPPSDPIGSPHVRHSEYFFSVGDYAGNAADTWPVKFWVPNDYLVFLPFARR